MKKADGMLIASFLTTIFYSATYPYIHLEIMQALPDNKYLAVNQIVNCISIVFFGRIWNSFSNRLFEFYPAYCIIESIANSAVFVTYLLTKNMMVYYVLDTLVFAVMTRNIICGNVKLRSLRYTTEESREHFDNNDNSVCAAATIIGSMAAMYLRLDIVIMLILAVIGNTIDNAFYICIYYSTKRKKEIKK